MMNKNSVRNNARRLAACLMSVAMVFSLALSNGASSYAESVMDLSSSITKVLFNNEESDLTLDAGTSFDVELGFDVSAGEEGMETTMDYAYPSALTMTDVSEGTLKVTAVAADATE